MALKEAGNFIGLNLRLLLLVRTQLFGITYKNYQQKWGSLPTFKPTKVWRPMGNSIVQLQAATIFQNKQLILKEVSIDVSAGEFVFLIGKTGTGKSSLIKTLYADLPLQEGMGSIVGYDLAKIKQKEIPFLRRKLGVVFQDFKLLPDRSIAENLRFVLKATGWKDKSKINSRIEEVLTEVGMAAVAPKYPFELSGGEQQRVAIARALLNTPSIIIADEPTGNLDPQTSLEIMEVFRKLHQEGMTILMATHDYNMIVKFPGKILRCDEGTVYEVVQKKEGWFSYSWSSGLAIFAFDTLQIWV